MKNTLRALCLLTLATIGMPTNGATPRTSLDNEAVQYSVPEKPYAVLQRGNITAVIVDNRAVDDATLPGHRAGYSGLASLTHRQHGENLFVPNYAGLNFEHIHDGTVQDRKVLFEPRNAPMELRQIDEHTVELYQAPTPHYGLESCHRYQVLPDDVIELTVEFIPRRSTFSNGYVGLFWASYIHQPESLDIHLLAADAQDETWVRGVTPSHGVLSTHLGRGDTRIFPHAVDFPLTLVFNRSQHRYAQPWYFGVSNGMAFIQMFRSQDQIRLSQSPSGGGTGNPAWDFQYFAGDYEVGKRYQIVMRAMHVPFESRDQVERISRPHRKALAAP